MDTPALTLTTGLTLHHPELLALFQRSMAIAPDEVRVLLALPKATLVADLRAILRHGVDHYATYDELIAREGFRSATMSAPLHATILLGELPGRESLQALLEFMAAPEEVLDMHVGDSLTEYLWEPLAKLAEGNLDLFTAFVEDPKPYLFARTMVAEGVCQWAMMDPANRTAAEAWYTDLITRRLQRPADDDADSEEVFGSVVSDLLDLRMHSLMPLIEELYARGLVGDWICGDIDKVRAEMAGTPRRSLQRTVLSLEQRYATMLRIELAWEEELKKRAERKAAAALARSTAPMPLSPPDVWRPPLEPIVRTEPKVGRNDPCPCGSGKKHKKCCGG